MSTNRSCKIFFRTTPEELEIIKLRMQEVGTRNISAYCRKMVLNGYTIFMDTSDMKEVLRLMKINSNNLNQYAKKANEIGNIYREDIRDLQQNQKDILQKMGKILESLSNIE